jgi:hypothetical protein
MPIPPKIIIDKVRIAGITKPGFVFRIVKRRSLLIRNTSLSVSSYIIESCFKEGK